MGDSVGDPFVLREAYEQCKDFEDANPSVCEQDMIEPGRSGITMTLLLNLGEHQHIETRFSALALPFRMSERILEVRIKSLLKQNRTLEARLLVETAKSYHQPDKKVQVSLILEFELLVNGDDDFEQMQFFSMQVFNSYPTKLIRFLPPSFNGKLDIYEFLIQEIANALDKMLDKIRAIDEIKNEDKLNDIVDLVLDSRLNAFGFHISDQSRGAFPAAGESTKKKQPGESDLPIMDRSQKIWMVCEALLYRGKTTAETHLQKAFNHHHKRDVITLLYYDTKCSTGAEFESHWDQYRNEILRATTFPVEMPMKSDLEEVSDQYNYRNSAIKIGKTIHGVGTVLYYIFVNINYKLKV